MGLLLDKLKQIELGVSNARKETSSKRKTTTTSLNSTSFDLESIPPEVSLQILKYLNATDLCLASCVWQSLANDDILWKSLCQTTWGYATIYITNNKSKLVRSDHKRRSYRSIFMHLDEATLTFNANGWKKVTFSIRIKLLFQIRFKSKI